MRSFFIKSFDKLVAVLAVLMAIGVVIFAFLSASAMNPYGGFGVGTFVTSLIIGFVSLVATIGSLYLVLGIYENTKRTAEAVEELLRRSRGNP